MRITFEYKCEPVRDEIGLYYFDATLKVTRNTMYEFTFNGHHQSKIEAERICYEKFLNYEVYEESFLGLPSEEFKYRFQVFMFGMPQEYQDLIWQLIYSKTGHTLLSMQCNF